MLVSLNAMKLSLKVFLESLQVITQKRSAHIIEQRNVEKSDGGEVRAKTFDTLLPEVGHRPAHGAGYGVFLRASPELRRGQVTAAGQAEGVGAVEQTGRPVGALGGKVV